MIFCTNYFLCDSQFFRCDRFHIFRFVMHSGLSKKLKKIKKLWGASLGQGQPVYIKINHILYIYSILKWYLKNYKSHQQKIMNKKICSEHHTSFLYIWPFLKEFFYCLEGFLTSHQKYELFALICSLVQCFPTFF